MRKHNGMRPQDVVILLYIMASSKVNNAWKNQESLIDETTTKLNFNRFVIIPANNKKIAQELQISESEVSESLYRSEYAGLLQNVKVKKVNKKALLDFIIYGIKYVYPCRPTGIGRGIATAHSAYPIKDKIIADEEYVWEHPEGNLRGGIIEPLYKGVPNIAEKIPNLYELLVLTDAIRIGTPRVFNIAKELLEKRFNDSW